jgi:hypothetical protein
MNSTGWVGKQATDRIACPLTRHRSTAPCPPLVLCFDKSLCNLRGETSAFAIYSKRPMELSKQLLTLWIFGEDISQNSSHPQGPKSEFKEVTAAHVGCQYPCRENTKNLPCKRICSFLVLVFNHSQTLVQNDLLTGKPSTNALLAWVRY